MRKNYSILFKRLHELFQVHGGCSNLLYSPFLHCAFFISLVIQIGKTEDWKWYDVCIACLPSIVGMSLTGYALILTFGSEQFKEAIRGNFSKNDDNAEGSNVYSPYLISSAAFAYYIVVQCMVLIFAILCKAMSTTSVLLGFIGTTFFIYSLFLAIAATLGAFFLSQLYDRSPKKSQ